VIAVQSLTKRYGRTVAVDGLTFEARPGSILGFRGPNGAGKTTTMAMLLGLVRPTSGAGRVLDQPISHPERYLRRVGALLETPALWPGLSARDNLHVLADLAGHDAGAIPRLLQLVGLADRAGDRYGRFSLGMKQRLGIAASLLGDPALLVLDEPTNGLDPAGMRDMRALISQLAQEDRTILVSSHLLAELEQVCDWLVIIDAGRVQYCGPAADFAGTQYPTIELRTLDPNDLLTLADVVAAAGIDAGRSRDHLVIDVGDRDAQRLAADLNQRAAAAGIVLAELRVTRPTIESAYLRMITEDVA